MPAASLKAMASDLGIPLDKAEKLWDKAKKIAAGQGFAEGDDDFYAYTTGVVKKMMGVENSTLDEKLTILRTNEDVMNTTANLEDLAAVNSTGGRIILKHADGSQTQVLASGEVQIESPAGLVLSGPEMAKHSAAGADRGRFLSVFMKAASGTRGKKLVAAFVNGNTAAFQAAWNEVSQQVLAEIPTEGASVAETAKGKGKGQGMANPIPPHRPGNHMPAKGKGRNQEHDNEPMEEHSPTGNMKGKRAGKSSGPALQVNHNSPIPPHRPMMKGKGRKAMARLGELARKVDADAGPEHPKSQELKDDLTKYGKARAAGKNDPQTKRLGEKIGKIRNAIRRTNSEHSGETAGVNNPDQTARLLRSTNNIIDGAQEEYIMRGLTASARGNFFARLTEKRAALTRGAGVGPSVGPEPVGSPAGGPGNIAPEAPEATNIAPMVEGAADGDTDQGGRILLALQGATDQTLTLKKLSEATGISLDDLLDVLNGIEAPVNLALSPSDTVTLEQATAALTSEDAAAKWAAGMNVMVRTKGSPRPAKITEITPYKVVKVEFTDEKGGEGTTSFQQIEKAATETAGKYAVGDAVTVTKKGSSRPAKITKMAGIKIGVEYTDDDGGSDSVSYFNLKKK